MLKSIVMVVLILLGAIALIALLGSQLPVKHEVSRTAEFRQSPQQLWDLISGPPTWRPDVQRYEVFSPADGHRKWREYGTHGQKMTYEVVEENPPQKLVTRIADPRLPFGGAWIYEITPEGTGSRLTITENGEIYNPIFRFVSRYVQGYSATLDTYFNALRSKLGPS
jgi:hypothetical protein